MSRASDRAYERIREMIISGELAPGHALGEEALAHACGVSRTPVRDALRRLEADMLVSRSESQRSFVADWSLDEIEDVFDLRAILEARAAHRAAERMTDGALARLRDCNARIGRAIAVTPPDIDTFLEQNREFHAIVLELAASRRLSQLLGTLIEQPVVWRTAHQYGHGELRRSHGEHEELLAAFARRDAEWAGSIMAGHIRRAFHAYADAHRGLAPLETTNGRKRA